MTEGIQKETRKIRNEIRNRTVGYVAGALGLVAGLAWNDAIKAGIEYLFPLGEDTLLAKLLYAAVVTVLIIIATTYLTRFVREDDSEE
jgi:hypothetical protein